jgi:hypothetical protein
MRRAQQSERMQSQIYVSRFQPRRELAAETDGLQWELDDRFHETGVDEAGIDGTGSMLVDSSFEKI